MKKKKTVFIFSGGTVAVCDENGKQMPKIQGGFYNYKYIAKLAKFIVSEEPEIEWGLRLPILDEQIAFYKKHPELLKKKGK